MLKLRAFFRSLLQTVSACSVIAIASNPACAGWTRGQFVANHKPVIEYHCVPEGKSPYPAVVLLHGAGARGSSYSSMEKICGNLADAGYYAEFIEYYSQTDDVRPAPGRPTRIPEFFPIWLGEIRAGVSAMDRNPEINPKKIGMMGFSLGAFLSLGTGATDPGKIAAIVEYYGELPSALRPMAANLPPTLILHGDADKLVPVAQAHQLDALMTEARRPHEMHIYPGANHAFNLPIPVWYNAADAADAWARSLAFFAHYLGGKPVLKLQASR